MTEFRVNTTTANSQNKASIAMDADGDFVVVWESFVSDGSFANVYGQRYNAAGAAQGGEFLVNTTTASNQINAGVSVDADGDFVVVWDSGGQDGSGYGIYGQRYNSAGVAQGVEFRVNTTTAQDQFGARVAVDADGDFVVVWSSRDQDGSSYGVYGQRYNAAGVALGVEFRVNTTTANRQTNASVSVDADGDFVVVWESSGQDGSQAGIYGQRFNAAGVTLGAEFQVNTATANSQSFPSVAMDADGDFVVVWESLGQDGSGSGVYGQRYNAAGVAQGAEFRVNTTTANDERFASVSMDADGDFIVVWASNGQDGSSYGVYGQRYNASGVTQGAEFRVNATTADSQRLAIVAADADGDFAVVWQSANQDGSSYGIYGQRYHATGVALHTEFQVNTTTAGDQFNASVAVDTDGDFIVVWQGQDIDGYGVYGQRYNAAGVAQGAEFRVNTTTASNQSNARIAMDADGDFVVVWQSLYQDGSGQGIYGQRYNAAGAAQGVEFRVNTATTFDQLRPDIAMDADGDFIVVWASNGQDGSSYGVYGQRYNAAGAAQGAEFRVNTTTANIQRSASVDMDADGDFVVVWESNNQDGAGFGIFGQRYNAAGAAQGVEFQVNTTTADRQRNASVALDADGDFVVVWESLAQDGDGSGIYGQRYNAAGAAQGAEFRVNTTTAGNQANASVSMDADGDFLVVWQSYLQDGSLYGVYGQRYNAAGAARGGEFRVNVTTADLQAAARVAMDANGNARVAWQSNNQDGSGAGVYAHRFDLDATPPAVASITSNDALLGPGETATFTITFSEDVTGFALADLTPTNGALSGFAALSARRYTVVFTPAADVNGTGGIAFAANSYADLASNNGPAGSFLTQQINTVLSGGTGGDDTLRGTSGGNTLAGGAGNDEYVIDNIGDAIIENPSEGTDTAWVGINGWTLPSHVEILRLFGAGTSVTGSGGNDIIVANAGAASSINGAAGADELWGGAFAHTLNGGAGDDIIRGQNGPVVMIGGADNDQFVVGHINATILENPNEGIDTAWVGVNNWTNFAHVEIARMAAPGVIRLTGADTAEDLVANQAEASRIDARGGHDVLWGSGFADTLNGEDGDDIIRGQGGADVMAGGTGNDQYVVFSSAATVTEAADTGYDIVYFAGTGTLDIGAHVEEARLSSGATGLIGNASANLLVGNNAGLASAIAGGGGADTIFGTAAADTLSGGAGNDVIYSQGGADRILYDATGWGYDQVAGFTAGQAKIQFAGTSGVTQFSQLALNSAGGNTQVEFGGFAILVFGMASMTESDFIFG